MSLVKLVIAVSVAAGVVSAGYGGRGVIPSAADLSPSDAAGFGVPTGNVGGATSWVPSRGVRPPPRPIVFPGSPGGVIDPGFAPNTWNNPAGVGRPVEGGGFIQGGSGIVAGGKPFRGGYGGGAFHGGRPSYVKTQIYNSDGTVTGQGGTIDGLGGLGGETVVVGGSGGKPIDGTGLDGIPSADIDNFGGGSVLKPAGGGAVKPIGGAGISGLPLDVPIGGSSHGGIEKSVEDVALPGSEAGFGTKPVVAPIGSEIGTGSVEGDELLVKPGIGPVAGGTVGGEPAVLPVDDSGFISGGSGTSFGGGVDAFDVGNTGDIGVKPGAIPLDGGFVRPVGGGYGGLKPSLVPIGGGGIKGGVIDGAGVKPIGGGHSGGFGFDSGFVSADKGVGGVGIDGTSLGPISGGHGAGLKPVIGSVEGGEGIVGVPGDGVGVEPSDGVVLVEEGEVPVDGVAVDSIDGALIDRNIEESPISEGVGGGKVVSDGSFADGTVVGPGVKPIGGGAVGLVGGATYGGSGTIDSSHFAVKPALGPTFSGGVGGVEPVGGVVSGAGVDDVSGIGLSDEKTILSPIGGLDQGAVAAPGQGHFGESGNVPFGGQPFGGSVKPGIVPVGGGSVKPGIVPVGGGSVGPLLPQVPPFGSGGHKPFLPDSGDRAIGEVHPGFEPGGGVGVATGGTDLGGVTSFEKPAGGFSGANRPYKPPRRYGR